MANKVEWDRIEQKIETKVHPVNETEYVQPTQAQQTTHYAQAAPASYSLEEFTVTKKTLMIFFLLGGVLVWAATALMTLSQSGDVFEIVTIMKSTGGLLLFIAAILGITAVKGIEKYAQLALAIIALAGLFLLNGGLMSALMSAMLF